MHSADHVFQRPGKHALSRDRSCTGARSLASASVFSRAVKRQQATAWMPRSSVRVLAMQSGWNPQPRQQPQQPQPVANRQPAPLARTPAYQAAPVFLELTQVMNKQVVTRTTGRSLGCISGAWLDPARGTLVSFDLDDRKPGSGPGLGLSSPARAGNIPLSALRQIGDVVLVHDESGLYEQDLDGRLGFVNPLGLDVRTRTGQFLGKVRDLSFSPDSGVISRLTYDEFGLPFLPISFFDCYSVAIQDVLSIGRSDIIVYDDAKYRERKESNGLFAAIPSLFKSLNAPRSSSPQLALPAPGSTTDAYRPGAGSAATSGSSRYLPPDYTYEQWQADLRRWEAETGMTYEQYLRSQGQPQQATARTALPPARGAVQQPYQPPAAAAYPSVQQSNPYLQTPQPRGYMQQPQQLQQQQQYGFPQQQPLGQQPMRQQQPRYDARQALPQQQYGEAAVPQGAPGWGTDPAAAAAGVTAFATIPSTGSAGAGQQEFSSSNNNYINKPGVVSGLQRPLQQQQQQQVRPGQQQQQPQQGGIRPSGAVGAPRAAQQSSGARQQQQQPSTAGVGAQPPQQPYRSQQSSPAAAAAAGRPLDEWMVRESRPRMNDALADGVLPIGEDGTAISNGAATDMRQPVQQQTEQPEVV